MSTQLINNKVSNWLTFECEDGNWFEPIIPQGTTVKVQLRRFDDSLEFIELPVKPDMLRCFYKTGWGVSLQLLKKYIPTGYKTYSIPEYK